MALRSQRNKTKSENDYLKSKGLALFLKLITFIKKNMLRNWKILQLLEETKNFYKRSKNILKR